MYRSRYDHKEGKNRKLTASVCFVQKSCMHVNTEVNLNLSPWCWVSPYIWTCSGQMHLTYHWHPLWILMTVLPRNGPDQIHTGLQKRQWMPLASSAQCFRAIQEWHMIKYQRCHWWCEWTHNGLAPSWQSLLFEHFSIRANWNLTMTGKLWTL